MLSIAPLVFQMTAFGLLDLFVGWAGAPQKSTAHFFALWTLCAGAYLFSTAWLATRWHRFVLLAEKQNAFSRPRQIWPYLKTMVLTFMLMGAIAIPMLLVFVTAMGIVNKESIPAATLFFSTVGTFVFYIFMLRLSTALPGAAIGASKPIKRSWIAMGKTSRTLAVLVLCYMLVQGVFQALMASYTHSAWLPGTGWFLIAQFGIYWFFLLFSLSVLTTLWGHYVEARPLR